MNIDTLQHTIVNGLEDLKAHDIAIFDTAHLSRMFDRVIIASGASNRHTRALAMDAGEWTLVDCADAVLHIFLPALRQYYRLEEIWGEGLMRAEQAPSRSGGGDPAASPSFYRRLLNKLPVRTELKPVQLRVTAILCQQFRMRALFDNAACIEYQNPVGALGGCQAVRDDEGRAAPHQPLKGGLDMTLRLRIERRSRFVQYQHRRVLVNRARNRKPLPLAAGEPHPIMADECIYPVGQGADFVHQIGCRKRALHPLPVNRLCPVSDICGDRVIE